MRKIILTVVAAAGLTAVGAAITFAATSSSVIQACANNKTHVLSLRTGTSCPSGTTGISWNQKGPSTAGPTGLDVRWIAAHTTGTGSATARCTNSHPYLVGGGGVWQGGSGIVQESGPTGFMGGGHQGWAVIVNHSSSNLDVYAFAACAK